MNKKSAIGILGGMGPQASAYLYKLLIDMSIRDFGAKNNNDFPEIILHSIPIPDFISSDASREDALFMLQSRVRALNKLNISCLAIACNTIHILLPSLKKISCVPFVSIIDEVVKAVRQSRKRNVGLLASPSTIRYKLYQLALQKRNIKTLIPNQQQINILEKVSRNILSGKLIKEDSKRLKVIADSLKEKGVEAIILGCTELPLVFPSRYDLPVYSSLEILSKSLLQKYYKQNTIQEL